MTRVILFKGILKDGQITPNDLCDLSKNLGEQWRWLGRRLKVDDSSLVKFDKEHKQLDEKAYYMLLYWIQSNASAATYEVLYEALSHHFVERKDLAENICLLKVCTS